MPTARPSRRVTHLLFNNVGSHGAGGPALFQERRARAASAAAEIGLPLLVVDSNLDAFYGAPFGFQQTHTPRNASVALLLQGGIGRFLYGVHLCPGGFVRGGTYDILRRSGRPAAALHGKPRAVSTGSEHTRVEKTLQVADLPASYRALDVCARGDAAGNCSTCAKCKRTLLTLEIAGLVERYAAAFDLAAYREGRDRYCGTVLRSKAPLNREIVAFAAHAGIPVSAPILRRLARCTLSRSSPAAWRAGARARAPGDLGMKIGAPALLARDGTREYRAHVAWSKGSHTLWYRVEERLADLLTTSSDAALVALLIPAMAAGEDIHLDGEVSERLYHSLAGPYQDLLRAVIPPLHRIAIHASGFQAPRARPAAVATGLSCGIDSYCLLLDHFFAEDPVGGKVTHLLFNNVGSHGKDGERVFRQRLARVAPVAARIGLPLVAVDSNLDEFYGAGLSFIQTHTPRNASVALLLQGGIAVALCGGVSNGTMFVGPTMRSRPPTGWHSRCSARRAWRSRCGAANTPGPRRHCGWPASRSPTTRWTSVRTR